MYIIVSCNAYNFLTKDISFSSKQSAGLLIGQQKKVYDFESFADDLATDPIIDQKSKEGIENDKNNRLERWARVVDKINNHQAK